LAALRVGGGEDVGAQEFREERLRGVFRIRWRLPLPA
ncbi:MAG: hypothetical protein ACI9UA_005960, partial [Pseudoalteromonas tetraodonis]